MTPVLLHEFFERSARRWPDRVAVDVPPGDGRPERSSVTYAALHSAAVVLAGRLQPYVRDESVVGILLPRTHWSLYAAQLGVLQAGAAYTCLDPSFPDERIREILQDAAAVALLTDEAGAARLQQIGLPTPPALVVHSELARPSDSPGTRSPEPQKPVVPPEQLAYLIYTSGTTGRPKAVMVEHRSIANLVASDVEQFRIQPGERVAQNSSVAYDSSVEEIWFAFGAGATLVPLDDATVRLGPDLIDWLRREHINVFCPPPTLLRATGCQNPESAVPELRLIFVGGEALPRDLADRWSVGRTLINDYGPTECTVTCLRAAVIAGAPVAIGRPVRGATGWVLDAALNEVPAEQPGELCIGGDCLARGYWRRPELTAEKFITHPRLGRLYRTGDLVHRDPAGQFFCEGRIDSQVKLRGYRVELGEVEARLSACPGVRAAGCGVQHHPGHDTLVAAVIPNDPARPPSLDALKETLRRSLPDYMVPTQLGLLTTLPTSVSGKLDREALVRQLSATSAAASKGEPPRNPLERHIQSAFAEILECPAEISIHDDFFRDLGGDSLSAAQLVTRLRDDPGTAWVTVRDLYEARSVAALAGRAPASGVSAQPPMAPAERAAPAVALGRRRRTKLLQVVSLGVHLILGSGVLYAGAFLALPAALAKLGLVALVLLLPLAALAGLGLYTLLTVLVAAAVKRHLIGQYRVGRAPVWGEFHLRNWIVQRTVRLVPWWLIESTEFQNAALRALGARIGRRVHLHHGVDLLRGGWDLLEIGDDVTVGRDVVLDLVKYEGGEIIMGRVTLASGCTLETHAYVGTGGYVGPRGYLTARSSLSDDTHLPAGERWDGIPARPAGNAPEPPPLPADTRARSPIAHAWCFALARLALAAGGIVLLELLAVSAAGVLGLNAEVWQSWMENPVLDTSLLIGSVGFAVLPIPLLLAAEAFACRLLGRLQPGVYSRWSGAYIRASLKAGFVDSASRWLYGTLFWPIWLRIAGMKIGPRCEISSLLDTVPELVEIGTETFCADGLYVGGPRVHRGTVTLACSRLGRNNFFGNGALVPGGMELPDDLLLGVCTVAGDATRRPGSSWFGHPPFELPRRVQPQFDRRLTHRPTVDRYVVRLWWEMLRFALPGVFALILPCWFVLAAGAEARVPLPAFLFVVFPLLNLAVVWAAALVAVALKWVLLGRVLPGARPLWSSWASRWDFFCVAWNILAADAARLLDGTVWQQWLLRAAGARIGHHVVVGEGFAADLPDPDMLVVEDGATVDGLFQSHTFEDRVLKTDYVTIRRQASVGRNAVLLYGAEVGAGTHVAPNSVVMKYERLLPGRCYEGVPTHLVDPPWIRA